MIVIDFFDIAFAVLLTVLVIIAVLEYVAVSVYAWLYRRKRSVEGATKAGRNDKRA